MDKFPWTSSSLPQPVPLHDRSQCNQVYAYIPFDELSQTDWLGSPGRFRRYLTEDLSHDEPNNDERSYTARYKPGTLVWVLQSKGRQHAKFNDAAACTSLMLFKKRRNKKNKRANAKLIATGEPDLASSDPVNELSNWQSASISGEKDDTNNVETTTESAENVNRNYTYHSRSEMFQRARVILDEDPLEDCRSYEERMQRRVLVRYSRGSTYRVCAYNLVPVLEPMLQNIYCPSLNDTKTGRTDYSDQLVPPLVVVVPETHIYRRIAKTHTTVSDSFMEIGCDYGITTDKIRRSMEEGGDVPIVWPCDSGIASSEDLSVHESTESRQVEKISCLGVDRSRASIDIANERFPQCKFLLSNVLVEDEMALLRSFCEQNLKGGAPSIVALDVNGNREVDGVLECVQMVMSEKWIRHPRLIIVKSRYLYWELKKERDL